MIKTEDKLAINVEEIMTRQVYSVETRDLMSNVSKMMKNHHIRHVPVMKSGKLVGILSLTDLQRLTFSATYGDGEIEADKVLSDMFNAGMIMHHDPETIEHNHTVRQAAEKFLHRDFHALPVMKNNELVGIITTTDILRYLLQY